MRISIWSQARRKFLQGVSKLIVTSFALLIQVNTYCYAQNEPTLAEFDVQLKDGQTLPLSDTIRFTLKSSNPEALANNLANWQGISVMPFDKDHLLIEMQASPQFIGKMSPSYLKDSFVIDISEPSIKDFVAGFSDATATIQLEKLAAYVSEYITRPTYENSFNIASVVASDRSGDCTEYAVLLTALARSLGMPAKVIMGTVIVEEDTKVRAFGHAWVEVWHNEKWQVLDAALYGSGANKLFYLPSGQIDNEGPGYTWGMAKTTVLLPINIRALASAN